MPEMTSHGRALVAARGCYPPQPSASADNTLDLHNSSYHTQPHPIIAKYCHNPELREDLRVTYY